MVKNGNGKLVVSIIGLVFLIVLAVGGAVWALAPTKDLKEDGCDPARANVTDIAVIKSEVTHIRAEQQQMSARQEQGFKDIMTELKK